jgi:hypothetical protein
MTPLEGRRLNALVEVAGPSRKSPFDGLKRAAGRASWSGFREQVGHLAWVDALGNTDAWLDGVAESKIADFAGEARAADAAVMGRHLPRSARRVSRWGRAIIRAGSNA